jgi:hypothetical protein
MHVNLSPEHLHRVSVHNADPTTDFQGLKARYKRRRFYFTPKYCGVKDLSKPRLQTIEAIALPPPPSILWRYMPRPERVASGKEMLLIYTLRVLCITSIAITQQSPVSVTRVGPSFIRCSRCIGPSLRPFRELGSSTTVTCGRWPDSDIRSHVVVKVDINQGKQGANTLGAMLR